MLVDLVMCSFCAGFQKVAAEHLNSDLCAHNKYFFNVKLYKAIYYNLAMKLPNGTITGEYPVTKKITE